MNSFGDLFALVFVMGLAIALLPLILIVDVISIIGIMILGPMLLAKIIMERKPKESLR